MDNGRISQHGCGHGYDARSTSLTMIVTLDDTQRADRLQKGLSLDPDAPLAAIVSAVAHSDRIAEDQAAAGAGHINDPDPTSFMPGGYSESFDFVIEVPVQTASPAEAQSTYAGDLVVPNKDTVCPKSRILYS